MVFYQIVRNVQKLVLDSVRAVKTWRKRVCQIPLKENVGRNTRERRICCSFSFSSVCVTLSRSSVRRHSLFRNPVSRISIHTIYNPRHSCEHTISSFFFPFRRYAWTSWILKTHLHEEIEFRYLFYSFFFFFFLLFFRFSILSSRLTNKQWFI